MRQVLYAVVAVLAFVGFVSAASKGGTPKLEAGKSYHVVSNCQQLGPTISSCYIEIWHVLEVGRDGWVRYRLGSGAEWYEQINGKAIREVDANPNPAPSQGLPVPPVPERFRL